MIGLRGIALTTILATACAGNGYNNKGVVTGRQVTAVEREPALENFFENVARLYSRATDEIGNLTQVCRIRDVYQTLEGNFAIYLTPQLGSKIRERKDIDPVVKRRLERLEVLSNRMLNRACAANRIPRYFSPIVILSEEDLAKYLVVDRKSHEEGTLGAIEHGSLTDPFKYTGMERVRISSKLARMVEEALDLEPRRMLFKTGVRTHLASRTP